MSRPALTFFLILALVQAAMAQDDHVDEWTKKNIPEKSEIAWLPSWEAATKKAQAEDKPIFIAFNVNFMARAKAAEC